MPQAYYYSSVAGAFTLTIAVTGGATIINVDTTTGMPNTPFKLILEPGTVKEEIVKVTSVGGLALTVVRGWDGTPAMAHDAGVPVRHGLSAEDLTLARQHEAAVSTVHGTTSAVVGVSDAQVLTNKTLSPATASGVGSVVKGLSGQSGDLIQVQDSLGNVLAKIASNGDATAPNLTTKFAALDATDATHNANIAANTSAIAGNAANIATHTTNISGLTTRVVTLESHLFTAILRSGTPLIGTFNPNAPIKAWITTGTLTTDSNGDVIVVTSADISGGTVLGGLLVGNGIFQITGALRMVAGNATFRVWNGTSILVSLGFSGTAIVFGQ